MNIFVMFQYTGRKIRYFKWEDQFAKYRMNIFVVCQYKDGKVRYF